MNNRTLRTLRATVVLFLCIASPFVAARAQERVRLIATLTGTSVNATSVLSNGTAELDGMLVGGEALVVWQRLSLRAGYSEGTLGIGTPQPGTATSDDGGGVLGRMLAGVFGPGGGASALVDVELVEGFAQLGWNVIGGLELSVGAQSRARVTDDDSERLLLGLVRARYEAPLLAENVRAYLEGWSSVAGKATSPEGSGSGRGGSAGMLIELGPVGLRLSYGVDQARYGDVFRRETVQGATLAVGYVVR